MAVAQHGGAPDADAASVLDVQRSGGALRLTMTRPEKLNSIGPPLVTALGAALDGLREDDRCVVLRGRGRAFSVGGDLGAVRSLADGAAAGGSDGEAALVTFHRSLTDLMSRLEALPVPVVAAVEGMAIAGGLEVVLACDLVLASTGAVFGDGHARYGLLPGAGGSARLPRAIGVHRAKHLLLTARQVSAATMADWGLVTVLTEPEGFEQALEELVADLVSRSRPGLALMKRLVDDGVASGLREALEAEQEAVARHARSPDYAEGLAAFAERRPPRFA